MGTLALPPGNDVATPVLHEHCHLDTLAATAWNDPVAPGNLISTLGMSAATFGSVPLPVLYRLNTPRRLVPRSTPAPPPDGKSPTPTA